MFREIVTGYRQFACRIVAENRECRNHGIVGCSKQRKRFFWQAISGFKTSHRVRGPRSAKGTDAWGGYGIFHDIEIAAAKEYDSDTAIGGGIPTLR